MKVKVEVEGAAPRAAGKNEDENQFLYSNSIVSRHFYSVKRIHRN